MFKRWVRRYGPQVFVMNGYQGVLIAPPTVAPVLSLLIAEAEAPYAVARQIVKRHSNSNATTKAFWDAVMCGTPCDPILTIRGERYSAPDKETLRRLYDLYLLYATAEARPQIVRAVALEVA